MKLKWGIISSGRISGKFAESLPQSDTGELLAVASRSQEKADAFGEQYKVPRRYGTYEALLADADVDAVYVSTPHPMHAEWAVKSAEAGKHILCEKPMTIDYPEAMAVVEAARRNDVFLMEAFMYRCHPQTAKLVELIREGAIGEVRMISATFSFNAGFDPESRLLKHELGGGGILDVGCYPVSMSRLVAGAAMGLGFAEPIEVKAVGRIGVTRVDDYAAAILRFANDIVAQVATGVQLNQENAVRIYGSDGSMFIPSPWMVSDLGVIQLNRTGKEPEEIKIPGHSPYAFEADVLAANLQERQASSPAMSWDDTLGNMRTLDAWRLGIGLTYDQEKPDAFFPTIDREPLKVRPGARMRHGRIQGLEKDVSRIVMGVMLTGATFQLPHTSVMFDEFFARGGNCFDTAYIYGGGLSERTLGQWIKNRGIRDEVVILAKGAHTPFCDPENLTTQLLESLDRLQTDHVDIYAMHRDNLEIPVSEFVDVLNEHVRAGRIRAFGGSNWTLARIDEANSYASARGLQGFTAVSNNFSLARMINAPWDGCIATADSGSRAWFTRTRIPLMAWSSLGRGFFVKGDPDDTSDADMVRCWYSEDNFRRLERARELAKKHGVEPVAIALAYVLDQPFETYALFGPATIEEMRISMQAVELKLSPDELRWLNLES